MPCHKKRGKIWHPSFTSLNFFDLCGYTLDCATHEKEKDYHESTKYRKHERKVSGWTNELLKDEHRTSNIEC